MIVMPYGRNKNPVNEIKNSRTSPDLQLTEFSLTKQKLDLEWTMNGFGKPFRKKSDQKDRKHTRKIAGE